MLISLLSSDWIVTRCRNASSYLVLIKSIRLQLRKESITKNLEVSN